MIFPMTQPKPWLKSLPTQIVPAATEANRVAMDRQANISKSGLKDQELAAATTQVNKLVEDSAKQKTQSIMLVDLVKELQGDGKIHFNIFYEADTETKIPLLSTGGAPPPMVPVTP